MFKASIILLVAIVLQNVFNYGFHFGMGRMLSVEDYGDFGSLSSLLLIFSVPCMTIFFVITKFISNFKAGNEIGKMRFLYQYVLRVITWYSVLFLLVTIIASPFIKDYLNIESVFSVILISVAIIAMFYLQAIMGVIQGLQRNLEFAIQIILLGLFKVSFALLFVYLGFKLVGAVASLAVSPIILVLIFSVPLSRIFKGVDIHETKVGKDMLKYSVPVLIANLLIFMLFATDLIIIPNFFSDSDTGLYTSAVTLGRAIYYLPAVIVFALFPKVAEGHANHDSTRSIVLKGLGLALLLSLIGSIIFYYSSEFWIVSLYGVKYKEAAVILKYIGFALIPLSLLNIYMNYELAKNRYGFIIPMGVSYLIMLGLMLFFNSNFFELMWILFGVPFALITLLFLQKGYTEFKIKVLAPEVV